MLVTRDMLLDQYKDFKNPDMKISREVKSGRLIRLRRGLYETGRIINNFQPAQVIYGPSYVSFGAALSYYGIIPEHAFHVVCAVPGRQKDRIFYTPICSYYYTSVPREVFPYEVETYELEGYVYRLATREKAVCDQLYRLPEMRDIDELCVLMYEDQRFDDEDISNLNYRTVSELAEHYRSKNVTLFSEYLGSVV